MQEYSMIRGFVRLFATHKVAANLLMFLMILGLVLFIILTQLC